MNRLSEKRRRSLPRRCIPTSKFPERFGVLELADDPVWCCRNASIDPFYKTREGVFPAPGIDDVALFQHVMSIGEVHADLKILLDKQDSNAAPPDRRDHALDDPK